MVTTEETRLRVLHALERWAETHPHRQMPVLVMLGREYTPEDIVDEVSRNTDFGRDLVSFLERSAKRGQVPIESFVERAIKANFNSR